MPDAGSGGSSPGPTPNLTAPPPGQRRSDRSGWNWLLLVPVVAVLYPPLFNQRNPWLLGMPFFYWYQLAVIPISVVCTLLVYRAGRGSGGRR